MNITFKNGIIWVNLECSGSFSLGLMGSIVLQKQLELATRIPEGQHNRVPLWEMLIYVSYEQKEAGFFLPFQVSNENYSKKFQTWVEFGNNGRRQFQIFSICASLYLK